MTPAPYMPTFRELRISELQRRLEVRKIVIVVQLHVVVFAVIVGMAVEEKLAVVCAGVTAGAGLHLVWSSFVAWRLVRRIGRAAQ